MLIDHTVTRIRTIFGSWLLLIIFLLMQVHYAALMGNNHQNIVPAEDQFTNIEADLPDARYFLLNTDKLWTSQDVYEWVNTKTPKELDEYKLHNSAAFIGVFLFLGTLMWSLCSVLVSPDLVRINRYLIFVPIVGVLVKMVEAICIGTLIGAFTGPTAVAVSPADYQTLALLGSILSGIKMWLVVLWFPVFLVGVVLTLINRWHRR